MYAKRIADQLAEVHRVFFDAMIATLYVRRANRVVDGSLHATLDIANVEVHESYRRMGLFSRMLIECEEAARMLELDGVYVENICNPILHDMLGKRGYRVVPERAPADLCMFKPLTPHDLD